MPEIIDAGYCNCGAITIWLDNDSNCSMTKETLKKQFGEVPTTLDKMVHCNHCINHWGIDLCACGSGNKAGECTEGFEECLEKKASQTLGEKRESTGWK